MAEGPTHLGVSCDIAASNGHAVSATSMSVEIPDASRLWLRMGIAPLSADAARPDRVAPGIRQARFAVDRLSGVVAFGDEVNA